jgi:hypothetical protein
MTKEEFAWTRFGVPLTWLTGLDEIPAPNALHDAFGDRYLYHHNPVYARVRDTAIGFGYRFSAEDTPLWRDYQSFGLSVLSRILSGGIIPYFDTGISVVRLLEANSSATLPLGFIAANLKSNHAFHEAAHCVAHSIMQDFEGELRDAAADTASTVVEAILAEAFANTVEALGSVFRHQDAAARLFYGLNSYYWPLQERCDLMRRAAVEVGPETRFSLLFLSHVEANLSVGKPSDSVCERVAEAGGCPPNFAALSRDITEAGFQLNLGFRDDTNPFYFDLLGHGRSYQALVKSCWLGREQNRRFARMLAGLFWKAAGEV